MTPADEGAALLVEDPGADVELHLQADRLRVVTAWERGELVTAAGEAEYRHIEDSGTDRRTFHDALLEVTPSASGAQVLVPSVGPDGQVEASGLGTVDQDALPEGEHLAAGGYAGESAGLNEDARPGYRYETDGPLARTDGLDRARAEGVLDLFVHNATLSVRTSDGGSWSNWTGYRTQASSPGTMSYELRVTLVEVEGGDLSLEAPDRTSLLAPALDTTIEGSVQAVASQGVLRAAGGSTTLQGEPLGLSGDGSGRAAPLQAADPADGQRLDVDLAGDFDVAEPGMHGLSTTAPAASGGPVGGATVGLLGSGIFAVVAGLLLARRRPGVLRVLPARLRSRLHRRWLEQGARLEDDGRPQAAARAFDRARAVEPARPIGWYHHARSLLEADAPERALALLDEAGHVLDHPPLDLTELEVAAAEAVGARERAVHALADLAREAPGMARGLARDLGLEALQEAPEVAAALDDARGDEEVRGYV